MDREHIADDPRPAGISMLPAVVRLYVVGYDALVAFGSGTPETIQVPALQNRSMQIGFTASISPPPPGSCRLQPRCGPGTC